MKDPHFVEEHDGNATAFTLTDFGLEFFEQ